MRRVKMCKMYLNSLAPWRYGSNFKSMIFKLITQNSSSATCSEIALRWMPQNLTKSEHWFREWLGAIKPLLTTRSHCWSQYWTSYMTQYGITRPQWVKYIFVFSKGEFQPTLSRNYQIYSHIKYFTNAGSVPWLVIIFLRTETPEIRKVTPM